MASLEISGYTTSEENNEICPTLTFKQRIIGFIVVMCIGVIFAIISWVAVFNENWTLFGVGITFSNLCAIGSSLFLAGPKKQWSKMWEETRWIATLIYILTMILTLVFALALKNGPLTIVSCILQYLAMIWYGLTYIPGARTVIKRMCGM